MLSIGYIEPPLHDVFRRGLEMERWTLEYLSAGHIRVKTPHGRQIHSAPSAMLVPPHTPYYVEWAGGKARWIEHYAIFDPLPSWHALLDWPLNDCELGILNLSDSAIAKEVEDSLQAALQLQRSTRVNRRLLKNNAFEKALLTLDEINPARGYAQRDERIVAILEFIEQHHQEPLDLSLLARQSFLSPSRFSHLFKHQMRQAPMQFVEQYRLERAAEKLLTGHDPIEQGARITGFNNAFHFSVRFHRRFGQSPREYRRNPR